MSPTTLQEKLLKLNQNLNILREREARHAGNAPLELLNQIDDHQAAIALTEQALAGELDEAEYREALKPLLVEIRERTGEAQVTIGDVGRDIINSTIAGRDVVIYNYHYHGQVEATAPVTEVEDEPIPDNPYRGLFTFRPEHAPFFFGREKFTGRLAAAVESRRLVTVLGASGSGKSSVVFAGLVPELVNRPGEPWLFTTFRPGDDPFFGLAGALIPLLEPELSKVKQTGEARDLATRLREGRSPLADYLHAINLTQPDHHLLLIADQFEELYTLCPDPDARRRFLDLLLAAFPANHSQPRPRHASAIHNSQSKIQNLKSKIILTLRADFLGQASLYPPFVEALQGSTELLAPMTEAELRDAIEKPAAVQNVTFEEGLVETLLADVGREEGSLPLLEFALSELWRCQEKRTLTHKAYVEIGQVEGALSRHADRAYARLSAAEKGQARRIFVQLVNPGRGTEDTRRLATHRELGQNWALVAKLANERLVVTSQVAVPPGEEQAEAEQAVRQGTVEVVHEALIRNWGQLRAWMEADREFLTWQLGLKADLARWEETGQDAGALLRGAPLAVAQEKIKERPDDLNEQEREYIQASLAEQQQEENRRRFRLVVTSVAAVVMAALAVFSIFQWQDARQQRNKAQTELNFLQTTDPVERLEVLHTLFSQDDPDSQARARHLFFNLPDVDQLALLRVTDRPEALTTVGRAILPNLADINGIYYTNSHLATLQETVTDVTLQTDLASWLEAREAAQAGDDETALARYNALLETNDQNPALYYERARMKAKLGQTNEALADLGTVMALAQTAVYERSGVLRVGPEFANREQMSKAVARLIFVRPDLAAEYESSPNDYPTLPAVQTPVVITDAKDIPMVQIPAGPFKMGSNNGISNEQPVHEVYLDAYYIDQYEVTNARYAEFLNEQGNQTEGDVTWYNPERGQLEKQPDGTWQSPPEFEKYPVTGVSWYGAKAYCAWRGGRLPTEAEWEKAARGDDERSYPWGEEIAGHLARYAGSSERGTAEVGHYPEGISPYGVYDMAGNVLEWVADAYDSEYYSRSPAKNPTGPEDDQNISSKVLRGGSWDGYGDLARAANRFYYVPSLQSYDFGVRCVSVGP